MSFHSPKISIKKEMEKYENLSEHQQFACRVIADHARATTFSIADGILPGNEGRNYVLRKIMRRAIYHGREHLGLTDPFFYKVCDSVVGMMNDAYPELETQRDFIGRMVRLEEERFGNTLTTGLGRLKGMIADRPSPMFFPNEIAFLVDTYGLPIDLIYVVLSRLEEGAVIMIGSPDSYAGESMEFVSEDRFRQWVNEEVHRLQEKSAIGKTQRKSEINPMYAEIAAAVGANKFHGYDATKLDDAKVASLLKGDTKVDSLNEGDEGLIILSDTPFYAESGGQVGDTGVLVGTVGDSDRVPATIKVLDTFAPIPGVILHKSRVEKGSLNVGDTVSAVVDEQKRDATRRNHTATHLLHAALKEVLGTHVKQAGSVVAPNYLRFDFTHYQPMTDEEIGEVEDLVNRYILQNETVTTNMMALEEAMRTGAVAMFGEKYGSEVRVLSVGDRKVSMALSGGTHVRATGDIGSFKITSDEAIASGVRRIRAITGFDAFARFREDEVLIDRSLDVLKTQRDQLPTAIEKLQDELKRTRREMDELKLKIATGAIGGASSNGDEARDIAGVKVIGKIVEDLDAGGMRQLSDTLLARLKSGVVVIGRKEEGKVGIIVRVSDDLTAKVKAGNVIKEIVPIVGGKGGGRPDMAEGGGSEPDRLAEAIDASYKVIENFLTS